MNPTSIFKLLIVNLLLMICASSLAQSGLSVYADAGSTNVSNGIYIKSVILGHYRRGKNLFETGIQTDLKNNNYHGFSGYTLSAARSIAIKGIPLEVKGFYLRTLPSEILEETNWGALVEMRHYHFEMIIGTNFRTYNFSHKAVIEYEIDNNNTRIHEIYNLMYSFSYYIKPTDKKWNLGLSVTNIDHFIINQETNPNICLNGIYKISTPVSLYMQACYKCAGVTNLELNHFGFFFRTGIVWNIN